MIWNETSTMSCSYDIPEMHELKSRAYGPSLDAHDHGSTGGRATATVATAAVFLLSRTYHCVPCGLISMLNTECPVSYT